MAPKEDFKPPCPERFYQYLDYGARAGGIVGCVRVAWESNPTQATNLGALASMGSITTRIITTAGWVTAVVATFGAAECFAESLRKTSDPVNAFAGGCSAGMLVSMYTKNPAIMLSSGIISGGFAALIDAAGEGILGDTDFAFYHTDPKGLYPRADRDAK